MLGLRKAFPLKKTEMTFRLMLASTLIVGILGFDQLSKWYILTHVMVPPKIIDVNPFFQLVLVWNKGISFGLLGSGEYTWVLSVFALLVTVFLGFWMVRAPTLLLSSAIALVIGGAVGNVIDRFRLGAVIDFLSFHMGDYYWPAFNIADSAICIGVGLILLDGLLLSKEQTKK